MLFNILLITITAGFCDTTVCNGIEDALAVLIQNEKVIQNKLDKWEMPPPNNYLFNRNRDRLKKLLKTIALSKNDSLKVKHTMDYLNNIQDYNEALDGTPIITDTINIKFLSNLLRSKNEDIRKQACFSLQKKTSFEALKEQKNYLKKNIENSRLDDYSKYQLFTLIGMTKEIKETIKNTRLQLQDRASAGDTAALDTLIAAYNNANDDGQKSFFCEIIMGTGQSEGVKAVLKDISKPIYIIDKRNKTNPCTSSTYHEIIINQLQRYHPKEAILTKEYHGIYSHENTPEAKEKVLVYWSKLRDWIWKNYQVKLDDKPPFLNIFGSCGPQF